MTPRAKSVEKFERGVGAGTLSPVLPRSSATRTWWVRALLGGAALLLGVSLTWPAAPLSHVVRPRAAGAAANDWLARRWFTADFATRASADEGDAPFTMEPDVVLSPVLRRTVAQLAVAFRTASGRSLHVTSGVRTPLQQAEAMYEKLAHGSRLISLYRDYEAAREVELAYQATRRSGRANCVAAMSRALMRQIARGVYISRHLYSGAVDVRSRDMTSRERRTFRAVVTRQRDARLLEEGRPPHFHIEFPVPAP